MTNQICKELFLIAGVPSATSLGGTGVLDEIPESFNLLEVLRDEAGESGWIPKIANIKNGGVWIDSATFDGRTPFAGVDGNVIETMTLTVSGTYAQRAMFLSRLARFAKIAREFWTTDYMIAPVYLKWHADGANNAQFALVYNIDVDVSVDFFDADLGTVTLSLERESAWRAIAPGDAPSRYTAEASGLTPSPVAGTGFYTVANLPFTPANAIVQDDLYKFDEIGTANVNYLDVDADDIPGDAPALTLVRVQNGFNALDSMTNIIIGRSIARDLFPAVNTDTPQQRLRLTLNGGDATLTSLANVTASKITPAGDDGLLSNGSIVTRYLARFAYAVGTTPSLTTVATWTRTLSQFTNRYLVFLRYKVSAGTPVTVSMQLSYAFGDNAQGQVNGRSVLVPNSTWNMLYLDTINLISIGARQARYDGTGLDTDTVVQFFLRTSKTGAETSTIDVADIILVPYDEYTIATSEVVTSGSFAYFDTTGYFDTCKTPVSALVQQSTSSFDPVLRRAFFEGNGIYLEPRKRNRLYFGIKNISDVNATSIFNVSVFIVPRWYGVRDD